MALSQQKFREIVLQVLFSFDIAKADEAHMLQLMSTELEVSKKNVRFALERVKKIIEKMDEIDNSIRSVSTSYNFDRIHLVSKNILRIGLFELFYDPEIPPKVAIAEAIRLSRKFSSPESANFVNAILDHFYQKSLGKSGYSEQLAKQMEFIEEKEQKNIELAQEHLKEKINSKSPEE